eukprot:COSAG06_NODE_65818_length_256_cov_0.643312_2_plen_27_part_01
MIPNARSLKSVAVWQDDEDAQDVRGLR